MKIRLTRNISTHNSMRHLKRGSEHTVVATTASHKDLPGVKFWIILDDAGNEVVLKKGEFGIMEK